MAAQAVVYEPGLQCYHQMAVLLSVLFNVCFKLDLF